MHLNEIAYSLTRSIKSILPTNKKLYKQSRTGSTPDPGIPRRVGELLEIEPFHGNRVGKGQPTITVTLNEILRSAKNDAHRNLILQVHNALEEMNEKYGKRFKEIGKWHADMYYAYLKHLMKNATPGTGHSDWQQLFIIQEHIDKDPNLKDLDAEVRQDVQNLFAMINQAKNQLNLTRDHEIDLMFYVYQNLPQAKYHEIVETAKNNLLFIFPPKDSTHPVIARDLEMKLRFNQPVAALSVGAPAAAMSGMGGPPIGMILPPTLYGMTSDRVYRPESDFDIPEDSNMRFFRYPLPLGYKEAPNINEVMTHVTGDDWAEIVKDWVTYGRLNKVVRENLSGEAVPRSITPPYPQFIENPKLREIFEPPVNKKKSIPPLKPLKPFP